MAAFVIYILKWAISLTLLYSLYGLFLRQETFHHFNRMVLMGILLTSMVLPFCTIHTKEETIVSKGMSGIEESISNEIVIRYQPEEETEALHQDQPTEERPKGHAATMSLVQWLVLLGLLGTAYFWGSYLISMVKLCLVMKNSHPIDGNGKLPQGTRLLTNPTIRSPFSWFRTIVIREEDTQNQTDIILAHELAHVQHHHSWDNLLCDITVNTLWWLPFAWMLRRDLRDVHEYQADQAVMEQGFDVEAYQMLLIDKATAYPHNEIVNNFEQNPLKRRFIMMFRNKSNKYAGLKVLYLLPLAAIALAAFAKPNMMEAVENEVTTEMEFLSPTLPRNEEPQTTSEAATTSAQDDDEDWQKNPRGIYKMTKMSDRSGREIDAPYDQYKICEDETTITFRVGSNSTQSILMFVFNINDRRILNYTGKAPYSEDPHATQIYASNGQEFRLRWWSRNKGHRYFPENDWVVEKYEQDKFSKSAQTILSLLHQTDIPHTNANPFEGRWTTYATADSEEELLAKLHQRAGSNVSPGKRNIAIKGDRALILDLYSDPNPLASSFAGIVEACSHASNSQLRLGNHTYEIHWKGNDYFYYQNDDNTFHLWARDKTSSSYYDFILSILRILSSQLYALPANQPQATKPDIPTSASDSVYMAPNVSVAEFPSGSEALMRHLVSHLRYTNPTYKQWGFQGRLLIRFVVEKDGSTQQHVCFRNDIKPTQTAESLHITEEEYNAFVAQAKADFEAQAIHAIQEMPRWRPAIHAETEGKNEYVRMQMTLPITFRP